ncbi:MAG: 2-hydroxyacyl-CoA dehydratase [Clostridiales bacterium]|nr:2-hydroxyacyl-CoA dehydratase [Clostridiales bacterium]
MADIKTLIAEFEQVAADPAKSVAVLKKETGKKLIGMFPYHLPEEIVYAAGMLPVGMWGGQVEIKLADKYLQSFCCSLIKANFEMGMDGTYKILDGVIMAAYCDTLKCICEDWKVAVTGMPMMAMYYPQNRKIAAAVPYMENEFKLVQEQLEKIAGKAVTEADLEAAWEVYEAYRAECRKFVKLVGKMPKTLNATARHYVLKAGWFMDKKVYTEKLAALNAAIEAAPAEEFKGAKVIVEGIMVEPVALLDAFVENDVCIVGDDLSHQSRMFRVEGRKEGTVYEKMAYRIVDAYADPLLLDEFKEHGKELIDMVKEYGADGVVVCAMKFCDPEEYDYPIFKEELEAAGIPVLYMEIEQKMDSVEQYKTRIQAFAETLA